MTAMRTGSALLIGLAILSNAEAGQAPIVRKDCFGDLLPVGAMARLGTVRFTRCSCAAYSPDGKIIATGYRDSVYLCDAKNGKKTRRLPFSGHEVSGIIFSSDGKQLAVVGFGGGRIDLWNLKAQRKQTLLQPGHGNVGPDWEAAAVFSSDGKTLFAANQSSIFHWDARTGKRLKQLPFRHNGKDQHFRTVVFAPDGKTIATERPGISVWDAQTGKFKYRLQEKERYFDCLRFSKHGEILATAVSLKESIHLWEVATGQELRSFREQGRVRALAFSADGKTLASAHNFSNEQSIQLRELTSRNKPVQRITAPEVNSIMFSPDEKTIAWQCCQESLRFLDVASKKEVKAVPSHRGAVKSVAYRDGKVIASGSSDGSVRIWDTVKGKQLQVLHGHKSGVNAITVSPENELLASASDDGSVILWDSMSGKKKYLLANGNHVRDVSFSHDGKLLASATWQVFLWDSLRGKKFAETGIHGSHLTLSSDGKTLAVGIDSREYALLFFDLRKKTSRKIPLDNFVTSVAYSPDGNSLAVGCNIKLYLLDAASGKTKKILPGHWNRRGDVAFSCDGRYLASVGDGWGYNRQQIQIFELLTYTEIHRFKRDVPVYSVAFSPDGTKLATGRDDATALIWDLRNLTGKKRRTKLSPKELADCWEALGEPDAKDAYEARVDLLHAPKSAVRFIAKHLHPASVIENERVERLIRELGDRTFRKRSKAQQELEQLAELIEKPLRNALKTKLPLEIHMRIERLLAKLATIPPPHRLRELRAIEILEGIGSPDAWQVLERLAQGNPAGLATSHARAALRRKKVKATDR